MSVACKNFDFLTKTSLFQRFLKIYRSPAVHRKQFTANNSPQGRFTTGQFTSEAINRKEIHRKAIHRKKY
jgi:hypothetical protein